MTRQEQVWSRAHSPQPGQVLGVFQAFPTLQPSAPPRKEAPPGRARAQLQVLSSASSTSSSGSTDPSRTRGGRGSPPAAGGSQSSRGSSADCQACGALVRARAWRPMHRSRGSQALGLRFCRPSRRGGSSWGFGPREPRETRHPFDTGPAPCTVRRQPRRTNRASPGEASAGPSS